LTLFEHSVILTAHTVTTKHTKKMRTKALLLTAAVFAAGIATSLAQTPVYSQNVVGYVNVTVPAGFTMIANPLKGTNDSINTVLPNVPVGTLLYKFNGSFGSPAEFAGVGIGWDTPSMTLAPGEGAFIQTPSSNVITFVGEVVQGTATNAIPAGFSIRSSIVPQSGGLSSVLGYPAVAGDWIYLFDKNAQQYANGGSPYESAGGNLWDPSEPTPAVGEAFWILKAASINWVRTFNVGN
jgi:hypothetical protein